MIFISNTLFSQGKIKHLVFISNNLTASPQRHPISYFGDFGSSNFNLVL